MNDKKEENAKKTEEKAKKILNILIIILLIYFVLAVFKSCGNNCKEKGCHEKIYKDGYCQMHFMTHVVDEYLDNYYNPDYGK